MLGAPLWMAHAAPLCSTSSALTAHTRHNDCVSTTDGQGLTLAHFTAQLEAFGNALLTSELNLSTFGPHPQVNLGYVGDKVSFS